MRVEELRAAHTAEHIFMRALSNINPNIKVIKVEFTPKTSYVYVKCPDLTWQDIIMASKVTNKVIIEDRRVFIEYFSDLEEAKAKYPSLRAYEERIKPPVRIVIIDGYDYAACKGEHVSSTRECILFLPLALKKAKKKGYLIEFIAGYNAVLKALHNITLLNDISSILGASLNTLHNTLKKLIVHNRELSHRLREITKKYLDQIPTMKVGNLEVKLLCSEYYVDKDIISQYAKKFIRSNENRLFISLIKESDKWIIVSASSTALADTLNHIINYIFQKYGGKGGGKKRWIIGYINNGLEAYNELKNRLYSILKNM